MGEAIIMRKGGASGGRKLAIGTIAGLSQKVKLGDSPRVVTGLGFKPDYILCGVSILADSYSGSYSGTHHFFYDGPNNKVIYFKSEANPTSAALPGTNYFSITVNDDGFTLSGSSSFSSYFNSKTYTYVAWTEE